MSHKRPSTPHISRLTFLVILLAAAFLRLWRLDASPPGFTHDEAGHGQDAIAILHGARPLYETIGYGREPLYDYATAVAMAILGRTDYVVLRWVSALFGLLTILAVYLWVRRAFGVWEAILACGWLAGSFWAVSVSRQALRSGLLPTLLAMAAYAWWRGAELAPDISNKHEKRSTWLWFALSGVFIAATLWTYMAARVTWALFLAFPIFLFVAERARVKRHLGGMLVALGAAAILAAPMFIWLQQHPGAEQRFNQLGQPLQLVASGDLSQVLANSLEALSMFTLRADDLWMYNLPGRPWLGAVEGALFYVGLAIALWRWKQPPYAFALMWLIAGTVPSLITGVSASATRAVAILPVLYVFPAIAVVQISNLKYPISNTKYQISNLPKIILILAALAIVYEGARTYHDYFDVWSRTPDVRVAYHTNLFEIAHSLDRPTTPPGETVVLSSIYPGRYHDPYTLELMLVRRDLSLRWVDGRGALIFPGGAARLIVPAMAPLDPALEELVMPHARLVERRTLQPDDLNPHFDVYEWDSSAALQAALAQASPMTQETELGHTIALIGYELPSHIASPGSEIALVTYWRVLSPPDAELDTVLFTHLLSPGGQPPVVAQQDKFDAPTWNWRVGEVFAQVHRLAVGSDTPDGLYPLEVGAYTRPGPTPINPDPPTTRLVVYVNGQAVGDHILLPAVQVAR